MEQSDLCFGTDNENSTIVKLSSTGRLSLSDITAATIGNLADSDIWDDKVLDLPVDTPGTWPFTAVTQKDYPQNWSSLSSTGCDVTNATSFHWRGAATQEHAGGTVLRPWEDDDKEQQTNQSRQYNEKPPPSYHDSVKRRREIESNNTMAPASQKRQRFEPDSTTEIQRNPVNIVQNLPSLLQYGVPVSHNPQPVSNNQHVASQNNMSTSSIQAVTSQNHMSTSSNQAVTVPNHMSTSSSQAVGQFLTSLQQASQQIPSHESSTSDILSNKITSSPTAQIDTNNLPSQLISSMITTNHLLSYSPWIQNRHVNSKMHTVKGMTNNLETEGTNQTTMASYQIPVHQQVFYPQKSDRPTSTHPINRSTPFTEGLPTYVVQPPLPSPVFICNQQPIEKAGNYSPEVKLEPMTPIGKGSKVFSSADHVSPAFESRLTESLSSLIGSPLPDSPLSKNPFFGDLQNLLTKECKKEIIPQTLFGVAPKKECDPKNDNVFARERNLQERFTALQNTYPDEVRQLSSIFRYQSALIETERFRTLHECQYPGSYKDSVTGFYDDKLHKVMDRVERSVFLLENADKENKQKVKTIKSRPHLGKPAVRLMEKWYSENTDHPYPDNTTIEILAQTGNIHVEQVKKWFANKRNRNQNTRTLTEIAIQKRKLGQLSGTNTFL